jgi:hypothetical protein
MTILHLPARILSALVAAGMLLAVPAATAQGARAAASNVKSVTTTLVGSSAHKECFALSTQQKLRYWYRAESAVDFNVQYVEGKNTVYPVKKDKSPIGSGTFQPRAAQDYCVVWTNMSKRPVTLSFEFARVSN